MAYILINLLFLINTDMPQTLLCQRMGTSTFLRSACDSITRVHPRVSLRGIVTVVILCVCSASYISALLLSNRILICPDSTLLCITLGFQRMLTASQTGQQKLINLSSGSQAFWFLEFFTLLKIIEKPKELPFYVSYIYLYLSYLT